MPQSLLQSELFGHVEGAFTGASSDRTGLIESAAGGTFFLDEIGELPLPLQATLLRVLQEKEVRRTRREQAAPVDVRFVFATNRDLDDLVRRGRFRKDLYFRIAGVRAARAAAARFAGRTSFPSPSIFSEPAPRRPGSSLPPSRPPPCGGSSRTIGRETSASSRTKWSARSPCNGRERAIGAAMLSPHVDRAGGGAVTVEGRASTIPETVERLERGMIREALARAGGNRTRASEELGITRQGLLKKLKRYSMLR